MLIKIIVIILLFIIVFSLGSGLYYLVADQGGSDRTVRALTWRVALSLAAFFLLMLGYYTGLVQPHGVFS